MNKKRKILNEYKKFSNHLGNFYPLMIPNKGNDFYITTSEAISNMDKCYIDPIGVVEVVNNSYLLGDRTLVKGLSRLSWMTSFEKPMDKYNLVNKLPNHDVLEYDVNDFYIIFKEKLKIELKQYIEEKEHVGILLSGGYDSRIVAGLLKELQNENEFQGSVTAFTWGIINSRDVVYAKEICKIYEWEIEHINLNSEILLENIKLAGIHGAEYSPYHLHAMKAISQNKKIDVMIAGSYGDSVGRAEFSGKNVQGLKPVLSNSIDKFGIINSDVLFKSKYEMKRDAFAYKDYIIRSEAYQYNEIEQELHYMRRKLNACMYLIGAEIPVFQLFTSPETFGLTWSLKPKLRSDEIYRKILESLPSNVGLIPWARTGENIRGEKREDLKGVKQHHMYAKWLREDLNTDIKKLVLSKEIDSLGIFNMYSLKALVRAWENQKTDTISSIDDLVAWIASLSVFVSEYGIKSDIKKKKSVKDFIRGNIGIIKAHTFCYVRKYFRD
jgi:asparagine synthase (glutamine-hydrolysing)